MVVFLHFRRLVTEVGGYVTTHSLTVKQRKFIDAYIELGNATKAALTAGYAKRSAYQTGAQNLRKPQIKQAINQRLNELESDKIAKADEVLRYLTKVLRGQATEIVVVATSDGAEEVENSPTIKDRMAAGRELLKRYPENDAVLKAQLSKLEADVRKASAVADISEAKAKIINSQENSDRTVIVDDISEDS